MVFPRGFSLLGFVNRLLFHEGDSHYNST
jgi:hypothetical protein